MCIFVSAFSLHAKTHVVSVFLRPVLFSFIIHLKIPFIVVHELENATENENSIYGFTSNRCIATFNCCFVKEECGRNAD